MKKKKYGKKKSHYNKRLIDGYRNLRCCACGEQYGVVGHHMNTGGMGMSGPDFNWNIIPLCQMCHTHGIHQTGVKEFVKIHPHVEEILTLKGWTYCFTAQRWVNYERNDVEVAARCQRSHKYGLANIVFSCAALWVMVIRVYFQNGAL